MVNPLWIVGLALTLQVPPPNAPAQLSDDLRRQRQAIRENEVAQLQTLLARDRQGPAAAELRALIRAGKRASGATRFLPLPEHSSAVGSGKGLANAPTKGAATDLRPTALASLRAKTGEAHFQLAVKGLSVVPRRLALADECLRAALERLPDHPEVRRLLGYVPHQRGWATPYAVRQLQEKKVLHPTYGWVPSSWTPHLEQGELPAPLERNQKQPRWLPANEADRLHGEWSNRWKISTEHFEIHTNVPLSEAIVFSRKLEHLNQLFFSLLADVFAEGLPLAQRFANKKMVGERETKPHVVYYFSTQQEFIDHLTPREGSQAAKILGLYVPPEKGATKRSPAYFFRDEKGQLPMTATLYHEVSHQLLFEAGLGDPNAFKKNEGNFWVFEGLGTYFETLTTEPDGSIEIGGTVGPRMVRAVERLAENGELIPTEQLVRLDQDGFNEGDVFLKYQEANALTVFLMQAREEKHRENFLDYVRDAARGRLKRASGRSLEDRLGMGYATLDEELIDFLKAASRPEVEKPASKE